MPYRKRTYRRRRRVMRRPRRYIRRSRLPRTLTARSKIHSFKRTCQLTDITATDNGAGHNGWNFSLDQLQDYSEFTDLFDQYRIKAIKLNLVPNFTGSPVTASVNSVQFGSFISVIDRNDVTNPSAKLDLMQYETLKRTRLDRGHKRYFRVNTIDSTHKQVEWNKWISTEEPDALYFGFKYWFDALGVDNVTLTYQVYATFYFQCKSVI